MEKHNLFHTVLILNLLFLKEFHAPYISLIGMGKRKTKIIVRSFCFWILGQIDLLSLVMLFGLKETVF